MRKVEKVTVTYGRKINLGDYNQAHLEIVIEAIPDKHENGKNVADQLWDTAKASIKEQSKALDAYVEKKAPTPTEPEAQPEVEQPPTKDWCMVHDCKMEQRTTKDGSRVFYSHKTTDQRYNNNSDFDSWFCNGKEPK